MGNDGSARLMAAPHPVIVGPLPRPFLPTRRGAGGGGGEKIDTGHRGEVTDPYTGGVVGTVALAGPEQVRRAFAIAIAAGYRARLARHERSRILERTAEILALRREAISDLITAESGLCKKETRYEVGRAIDVFRLSAAITLMSDGQMFPCDVSAQGRKRMIYTRREPLRAICAITPFNHPLNQVAHKVAPSIASNNCMVLKPSEQTPLTALLLAAILYEAGLPPEMLSVVSGRSGEIGEELVTDPHVDLVTFTGGTAAGKRIARLAAYRRTVLELGGNDPLIVMEDADLERAADLAVSGAYRNAGQRCTAVKRILVQESVADPFVELLSAKSAAIRYGDPTDPGMDMGPVISEEAAREWQARVDDAVARQARLLLGNERDGALYSPTVVDHVPPDCRLVAEETFGPVAPVIRFETIDEAIAIANGTPYGLSSAVCTDRLDWITRFVEELQVRTVNIWEVPGFRTEASPFGGIKDSGLGSKEGVLEAMKAFTNLKTYSLPWTQP